jgi:hypothetical protein
MNKPLKIAGGLIAIYLAVRYAPGAAQVLRSGAAGGATVVRSFQGR